MSSNILYYILAIKCFYQPIVDGVMSVLPRGNPELDVDERWEDLEYFFARYSVIPNVGALPYITFTQQML